MYNKEKARRYNQRPDVIDRRRVWLAEDKEFRIQARNDLIKKRRNEAREPTEAEIEEMFKRSIYGRFY